MSNLVNQRLNTQNIADALSFVARWSTSLTDGVYEVDAGHPFVDCELGFAAEVVEVLDQVAEDEAGAVISFWTDSLDYVGGEVWVEA